MIGFHGTADSLTSRASYPAMVASDQQVDLVHLISRPHLEDRRLPRRCEHPHRRRRQRLEAL